MSIATSSRPPAFPMFTFSKSLKKVGLPRLAEKNEFNRKPSREQTLRRRAKCSSGFVHGDRTLRPEKLSLRIADGQNDRQCYRSDRRGADSLCSNLAPSRDPSRPRAERRWTIDSKRSLQISPASDLYRNRFLHDRLVFAHANDLDRRGPRPRNRVFVFQKP